MWHLDTFSPPPGSLAAYANAMLRLSWSGVDLFFVLSGFLIGGILVDQRESQSFFRPFYQRRAFRIFRIYYLWWIAFCVLSRAFAGAISRSEPPQVIFWGDIPLWPSPLYQQNIFMALPQTFRGEWIGVTWSLAVEEQFYMVLPCVVRFTSPRRLPWLVLAFVVAAPLARTAFFRYGLSYHAPYTLLVCRADALASVSSRRSRCAGRSSRGG